VSVRTVGLRLLDFRIQRRKRAVIPAVRNKRVAQLQLVWDTGMKDPNLLTSKTTIAKDSMKRNRNSHQESGMRKWVQRAVLQRAVWATALALRKMSARRRVNGQALRGAQTARAAGGFSIEVLAGEMVDKTWSEVTAAPHQVHAGAAQVADSGIVAPAGHQTARTAAAGATANRQGAQTVGSEATAGGPAVHGATADGARPVVVGAAARAHGVKMRGVERTASRLVV